MGDIVDDQPDVDARHARRWRPAVQRDERWPTPVTSTDTVVGTGGLFGNLTIINVNASAEMPPKPSRWMRSTR